MLYLVFQSTGEILSWRRLPQGYEIETWHPGLGRMVPPTLGLKFALWWLLHWLRLFDNRDYSVLLVRSKGRIVHRTCLIPRYFRWPFMAVQDLQVSSTWTHPEHRCRGLATYALQFAASEWVKDGRKLWYVTHDDNAPSLAVCRKIGFRLLAQANRTGRFGLRIFGRLVLLNKPEAKV
jgi:RimJ/RimL family protein N-acetyltransferase